MIRLYIFNALIRIIGWLFGQSISVKKHNNENILTYPETTWDLVPFPKFKRPLFNHDNLATVNRHTFIEEPCFYKARLAAESRWIESFKHQSEVRNITWRLHTSIWAAGAALKSGIDNSIFVECGTGRGFMATGIATYYDFEKSVRPNFYLIDIFSSTLSDPNAHSSNPAEFAYTDDAIEVEDWFRKYPSIKVIQGLIPDCLAELPDKPIGFLHVDLNSATAEESALAALKGRFRKGSIILFDDYGGFGGQNQAIVHEAFAKDNNRELLILPTGQALIVW